MRLPPLDVQNSFPTPNYVDPPTRGPSLIIVNAVFMTFVVLTVAGRFYSRIHIQKWFGVDDAMMVLAFIFTVALTTVVVLADVRYGWDRHIWDLPFTKIQSANIIAFIAKLCFTLAATFTRLSLICFYYRLIKDSGIRWFIWVLHASVAWQIALCITFVYLTIGLCDPVESYWAFPPPEHYKCLDEGKIMLGAGVVSSFSDFMTVVLPIPIIMRLQLPLWHRIGVCVLLSLGLVATIAGALRTYWTWYSLIKSYDETWYAYPLWIAAAVEIDVGVICACAPALKGLLQKPLRHFSSRVSSKISSLRAPSSGGRNTSSEGTEKPGIFNPLRSLPWFQVSRLGFEPGSTFKGANDTIRDVDAERDFSRDDSSAIELNHKPNKDYRSGYFGSRSRHEDEIQQEGGAASPEYPELSHQRSPNSRPSTPSLQIMMRHSFEQCSDYGDSGYDVSRDLEKRR